MRPLRLALRFFRIAAVAVAALCRYGWRRLWRGRLDRAGREQLRGEVLAETLERLGATFVKLGQILSTRPDLLGPGYTGALARLQDRVPPEPYERIRTVLEQELSEHAWKQLERVDPEPLAAASVAQVHTGRLVTGEPVAIKVQRPNARPHIERDLVLMHLGARTMELIPSARLLSMSGAVERFGEAMHGQLDFRREADNNRRFARNFEDVDGVEVPDLHEELCTERVLTMHLVQGVRATEPEKVGGHPYKLARRGLDAILRMVFQHGFVHADLHPGNIILTADDRVVLIDLGLVAEIPDEMKRPWVETFMALASQDGREAARLFYVYAPHVGTEDYAAYERDVVAFFEGLAGKTLGEVETSVVVGGVMNILRRHRVQIDPVFTVVNIAILVAEGLGKQLDPSLDVIQLAVPYLTEAMATAPAGRGPSREVPEGGPAAAAAA